MGDVVQWVLELNIKDGKFDAFEALMNEMVAATNANEPDALAYEWFVSDDRKSCHIYERYADSAAVMTHLGNFGAHFAKPFLDALEPTRLTVYGCPSDEAKGALAGLNAAFMEGIGGYSR
ncbi:MAG: putative quinol monooxygenase [Geminicoccaceae bacterium]